VLSSFAPQPDGSSFIGLLYKPRASIRCIPHPCITYLKGELRKGSPPRNLMQQSDQDIHRRQDREPENRLLRSTNPFDKVDLSRPHHRRNLLLP